MRIELHVDVTADGNETELRDVVIELRKCLDGLAKWPHVKITDLDVDGPSRRGDGSPLIWE